ncbi:MAG: mechanosensitive ion channel [Lentisphaeria bacterium]|nr:mechanosensitive ion channel [Lentisphaeria bacterium]
MKPKAQQSSTQDPLDPNRLFQTVSTDAKETENWFFREQDKLLDLAFNCFLSIILGILAAWAIRKFFRFLGRKHPAAWKWKVLYALTTPMVLLAVLISCFLFSIPVLKTLPASLYDLDLRLFYASAVFALAWGIFRLVAVLDQKIRRLAERSDNSLDKLTVSMIGNTLKIAIAVTAVLFIGQNIFDLNITALLASAGIIGLAIALAAKDTISNFFGTIVIIADCPYRIGDRIESGKINGIVTHIGMRSTRIMTDDESVYTIPNSELTNTPLCNINRRGSIKHVMDLGLTYDTSPEQMEKALRILHEILDDFHGPDPSKQSPHIYFSGFGAYSLNIHVIIWLKTVSFAEEEKLLNELNLTILKRFNEAGLEFAYPTQTLFLSGQSSPGK